MNFSARSQIPPAEPEAREGEPSKGLICSKLPNPLMRLPAKLSTAIPGSENFVDSGYLFGLTVRNCFIFKKYL